MAQYIDNTNPNGRSASPVLAVVLVIALILIALLVLPRLFANDADTTVNITDTNNPSGMQQPGMMDTSSNEMNNPSNPSTNPAVVPVVNTTINSTTTTTTGTTTR